MIEAHGSPSFMAPLVRSLRSGRVTRADGFLASQAMMRLNNGIFDPKNCELDRILYTWEHHAGGKPRLEKRDTMFQPWGYGYYYTLEDLYDQDGLQYTYDRLWA